MALVLAQAIEETSLRTAQQGTMSAGGDDEPGAAAASLHGLAAGGSGDAAAGVAVASMAQRCDQAAQLARRFKQQHPNLRLINQLVSGPTRLTGPPRLLCRLPFSTADTCSLWLCRRPCWYQAHRGVV